jgi:hypothetical protein
LRDRCAPAIRRDQHRQPSTSPPCAGTDPARSGRSSRPPGNEGVKAVRRFRAAAILEAVLASAKLAAFTRVDATQPDACSVDFQRVAIDDAGLTRQVVEALADTGARISAARTAIANFTPSNQLRFSCSRASRRLVVIAIVRETREGRSRLSSYFAARSNRRLFMNGSAFSARLRHRSACSLIKELST